MTPTQLSTINVHVLCAVLKSFLASLKEPLVTWTMRESFTRIAYVTDDTDVQTSVCVLVPELPQPSRDTLAFLVLHLQRFLVCRNSYPPIPSLCCNQVSSCPGSSSTSSS